MDPTKFGWWFSAGISVSSPNKTDHHDRTEILLEVALNRLTLIQFGSIWWSNFATEEYNKAFKQRGMQNVTKCLLNQGFSW